MKYIQILFLCCTSLILLSGCSSTETQKTSAPSSDSLYVFDEIPQDTTAQTLEITPVGQIPPAPVPAITSTPAKDVLFFVQVGAFSTEDKAQVFIESARKKIKKELRLYFSQKLKLHIVQVVPGFSSKAEAEGFRNELWKVKEFKDAWVTTGDE